MILPDENIQEVVKKPI